MEKELFSETKARIKEALEGNKNPVLTHAFLGYVYGIYEVKKMPLQQYEELVAYIETFAPVNDEVRTTLILGKNL